MFVFVTVIVVNMRRDEALAHRIETGRHTLFDVRVTDVEVRPFNTVELSFAAREGEGDSSLEYWARVHQEYFEPQCADWGVAWSEDLPTVCEGFELVGTAS